MLMSVRKCPFGNAPPLNAMYRSEKISWKCGEVEPALASVTFLKIGSSSASLCHAHWLHAPRVKSPVRLLFQRASCSACNVVFTLRLSSVSFELTWKLVVSNGWSCMF